MAVRNNFIIFLKQRLQERVKDGSLQQEKVASLMKRIITNLDGENGIFIDPLHDKVDESFEYEEIDFGNDDEEDAEIIVKEVKDPLKEDRIIHLQGFYSQFFDKYKKTGTAVAIANRAVPYGNNILHNLVMNDDIGGLKQAVILKKNQHLIYQKNNSGMTPEKMAHLTSGKEVCYNFLKRFREILESRKRIGITGT